MTGVAELGELLPRHDLLQCLSYSELNTFMLDAFAPFRTVVCASTINNSNTNIRVRAKRLMAAVNESPSYC